MGRTADEQTINSLRHIADEETGKTLKMFYLVYTTDEKTGDNQRFSIWSVMLMKKQVML